MTQCIDVASLVSARARKAPAAVALSGSGHVVTYGQLEARAGRLAHRLRGLGVGAEHLVALIAQRSPALAVGALGIMKTGGVYVALDPSCPELRLAAMLADVRPAVVLAERDVAGRVPPGPWTIVTLGGDGEGGDGSPGLLDLIRAPIRDGARRAYVVFTSGSTGVPKGVEITHAGLANLVAWHHEAFGITPADRATQVASPGFDAAVWELWPYLTAGASVHAPDEGTRLDPVALRDWLVDMRITVTFAPTPLAEQLMTLPWPDATALRIMLTGADTLHRHPPASLPFVVVNNYGPTECTVVTTSGIVPVDAGQTELPSIGRPIPGVEVYLLDEACQPVAPGDVGEVYVGGLGLARGYLNRPDLTSQRFVTIDAPLARRDPGRDGAPCRRAPGRGVRLYRTGDRARLHADGTLAFEGRSDGQIKIRGHRIEPDEIVAVLDAQAGVVASTVVARRNGALEPRLVAYVVPASTSAPAPGHLLEALRRRVPDYMLPATFVRLDALPLTANGKLDAGALPAPSDENRLTDTALAPAGEHQAVDDRLAQILTTLLQVDHVEANDNFFLLGGHSLLGTQVIARVREAFGVELSLRTLFAAPTLTALANEIVRSRPPVDG